MKCFEQAPDLGFLAVLWGLKSLTKPLFDYIYSVLIYPIVVILSKITIKNNCLKMLIDYIWLAFLACEVNLRLYRSPCKGDDRWHYPKEKFPSQEAVNDEPTKR